MICRCWLDLEGEERVHVAVWIAGLVEREVTERSSYGVLGVHEERHVGSDVINTSDVTVVERCGLQVAIGLNWRTGWVEGRSYRLIRRHTEWSDGRRWRRRVWRCLLERVRSRFFCMPSRQVQGVSSPSGGFLGREPTFSS